MAKAAPVALAADTPGITLANVLYSDPSVPLKTMTLYNNSNRTLYPMIYGENTAVDGQDGPYKGKGLYDPFDTIEQEYRGYVGYEVQGKNGTTSRYLGLPAHQKVTISVPLVFWDSGRMAISTNGAIMQEPGTPVYYQPDALRFTTASSNFHDPAAVGGIVQWYHYTNGPAVVINSDAPAQLIEETFRDVWMGEQTDDRYNLPTWPDIQKQVPQANLTLINYDVSYVDSMMLPVAVEATDVTVPFTQPGDKHHALPYGWAGANLSIKTMQGEIQKFTTNAPTQGDPDGYLGSYFGGLGYNEYYFPPSLSGAGINIPAGFNVIQGGALGNARSAYDSAYFNTVSGGKAYQAPDVAVPATTTAGLNTLTGIAPQYLAQLTPGMLIVDGSPGTSPIPRWTTIQQILPDGTIVMSDPASSDPGSSTTRDYVFVGSRFSGEFKTVAGRPTELTPVNKAVVADLSPGMLVAGPSGLPAGTKILSIAPDGSSITLTGAVPHSTAAESFSFSGALTDPFATKLTDLWYSWARYYAQAHDLAPIPYTTSVAPPQLAFTAADTPKADAFGAEVYNVMSALSKIPVINSPFSPASQLVSNVIGCNVGMIPGITKEEAAALTGQIISLMRGVVNYQDKSTVHDWYSPPAAKTAGASLNGEPVDFNVYNLNPYVWFVKANLKLSGYAFSVDDGISDVGANGPSNLAVAIGGIEDPANGQGLPNPQEYKPLAPWGSISIQASQVAGDPTMLKLTNASELYQLGQLNPGMSVASTGKDVEAGTELTSVDNQTLTIKLTEALTPSKGPETYTFSG